MTKSTAMISAMDPEYHEYQFQKFRLIWGNCESRLTDRKSQLIAMRSAIQSIPSIRLPVWGSVCNGKVALSEDTGVGRLIRINDCKLAKLF